MLLLRIAVISLLGLSVAGCPSSREELRRSPSSKITFTSKKPLREVSGCVSEAWQNEYAANPFIFDGGTTVSSSPTKTGWAIGIKSGAWNMALLDLFEESGGGTRLELMSDFSRGAKMYSELIPPCL